MLESPERVGATNVDPGRAGARTKVRSNDLIPFEGATKNSKSATSLRLLQADRSLHSVN